MDIDFEPTLSAGVVEFNVRAKIDSFSSLLSQTIICFYQFLASDTESEGEARRKLLDEYITVGGAASSTKILLDNSDERKAEGYLERRKKIENLWVPGGHFTQFAARMDNICKIMSKAIEDHRRTATPLQNRSRFPLSLERLDEEIRHIQVCKRETADALYSAFYKSHRKLEPKSWLRHVFHSAVLTDIYTVRLALGIIEWIGFVDTTDRQEFMSRERQEGTCQWVFNRDVCKQYHEWRSSTHGFLWIQGKGGSGKSVILASIVDQIFKELWEKIEEQEEGDGRKREYDDPPYVLPEFFPAFHFFDFRDARSMTVTAFLKSLFVQFLQIPDPDLAVTFPDLTQRYLDGLPPPTDIEAYKDLVLHAMRLHQKKAVFVDGLNECDDVPTVMDFLEKMGKEKNVRILVASRPDPEILAKYLRRPTIKLENYIGYTISDMREWLMKRMTDCPKLQPIPEDKKIEMLDTVTPRVQGSFWHAQCIIDSLEDCWSVVQINTTIEETPKDLERIYYDLLCKVNEGGEDIRLIVSGAIRWLSGALRPVSLSQIIEAVQIELRCTPPFRLNDNLSVVTPGIMLMLCGDLVKIDERTARLGLGHSSVRAFLMQPPPENEGLSRYFLDLRTIHRDLALRSITYIMADDIEKAINRSYTQPYMFDVSRRYLIIDRCPMLTYVFDGGFEHLRYYAQEDDDAIDMLVLLQNHIREKPAKFQHVFEALHDRTEGTPYQWILEERELALAVLVRYGPPWMLKRYLLRRRDLAEGGEKEKLMKWAEKIGRFDHREMLVGFELPHEGTEDMKVVSEGSVPDDRVGMDDTMEDVVMGDEQ